MLGSSDADIDAVLLLNEATRAGPYHGYEHQVKLSTLRAINRKHLIFYAVIGKAFSDSILLSIVWGNHVYAILRELLNRQLCMLGCNCERVTYNS